MVASSKVAGANLHSVFGSAGRSCALLAKPIASHRNYHARTPTHVAAAFFVAPALKPCLVFGASASMCVAARRDAQSQSGRLPFGSLRTNQQRQSATCARLVGCPSFGGQRVETAWPRSSSIGQNLWKSNHGSGHAKVKHLHAQPGCRGLNALAYAHPPNWAVKRTPILASKYWFPACFALRCRLPWALGLHFLALRLGKAVFMSCHANINGH